MYYTELEEKADLILKLEAIKEYYLPIAIFILLILIIIILLLIYNQVCKINKKNKV